MINSAYHCLFVILNKLKCYRIKKLRKNRSNVSEISTESAILFQHVLLGRDCLRGTTWHNIITPWIFRGRPRATSLHPGIHCYVIEYSRTKILQAFEIKPCCVSRCIQFMWDWTKMYNPPYLTRTSTCTLIITFICHIEVIKYYQYENIQYHNWFKLKMYSS